MATSLPALQVRVSAAAVACDLRSAALEERLDLLRVTDERRHHRKADQEENSLRGVNPVRPEIQQSGDRPAAGEGRTEYLGADQDRGTQHGRDVDPVDAPTGGFLDGLIHHGPVA